IPFIHPTRVRNEIAVRVRTVSFTLRGYVNTTVHHCETINNGNSLPVRARPAPGERLPEILAATIIGASAVDRHGRRRPVLNEAQSDDVNLPIRRIDAAAGELIQIILHV